MKILIAGDFCPMNNVAELFERDDYVSVFGDALSIIKDADYSIVNMECPITSGREKPIIKCGPNLQCSEKGLKALKWAGFDGVTLANNHFLDYGEEGVSNTIKVCKEYGIDIVGGGRNIQEASKVLYKRIGEETLAIINCCEHEFSIATETSGGSNPLSPILQFYAIQEAMLKADYVLVIVHGGHEYYQLPSPQMQEIYRFFVDAGADVVVNHHQHCYSGYEVYKGKPIFYGLGNFCFDSKNETSEMWCEGFMVKLSLSHKHIGYDLIPFFQCCHGPQIVIHKEGSSEREKFLCNIKNLNQTISKESELMIRYRIYLGQSRTSVGLLFEPYSNRILSSLYRRNLLPSLISRKKMLLILAYLQCESHYVKVLHYLKNELGTYYK